MIKFDKEKNLYYFLCPHEDCGLLIEVPKNEINCKIFRHAVYKDNLKPIHPHSDKITCEGLKNSNKVFGCGKPFIFDGEKVEKCDYI